VSRGLRGVLHRAVDFVADPGDAEWETGGRAVRAVAGGFPVRDLWAARAAGGVREPAADGGDVRRHTR